MFLSDLRYFWVLSPTCSLPSVRDSGAVVKPSIREPTDEAPSDDSSAPTGSLDPEATEASSQDTSESSHHASPLTRTVLAKFKLVLQQRTLWACLLLIALEYVCI